MVGNPHYLYRMTVLVALAALAPAVSHDVLCHSMLPVVVSCAKDKARPRFVHAHGQRCGVLGLSTWTSIQG